MRVVVTGARGQLGAAIVREFRAAHDVEALDRTALDITNAEAVFEAVARLRPDAIVNCAAYNAVDAAEKQPVAALQTNAVAVRTLARAAAAVNAALVQFSSDFVFDGHATEPYSEDAAPNPRSVYATSKLLGEWFASSAPSAYILRVESLFGVAPGMTDKGSVAGIVAALRRGAVPTVFEDRTVSPTFIFDAARATRILLERGVEPGLYHCVNSGHCTWLELATEAARQLSVPPRFDVLRLADLKLAAERPLYCALSNRKLVSLGIPMPAWSDALCAYIASVVETAGQHPST
jgi:dTDP-4-dehydrorhamnose reductase